MSNLKIVGTNIVC